MSEPMTDERLVELDKTKVTVKELRIGIRAVRRAIAELEKAKRVSQERLRVEVNQGGGA